MSQKTTGDMHEVLYVTSNPLKLRIANDACRSLDIQFISAKFESPEIQAEEGEPIARHKAATAYEIFKKPLVVSDDSWSIPALNGFPGPYMKSINHWFSKEDWFRLTSQLDDRRIILKQIVVFQDAGGQKLFSADIEGQLLNQLSEASLFPHLSVISFDGGKTSSASLFNQGKSDVIEGKHSTPWHDFAKWYKTAQASR